MYLLDTNIVSELIRRKPDAGVVAWFAALERITLSAITVEELAFGVERAKPEQRKRLQVWFEDLLSIPAEIVPVDEPIARASGALRASRELTGQPTAQADMLIAATALVSGRTLVTRNTKDFAGCGVPLLNPFAHDLQRSR